MPQLKLAAKSGNFIFFEKVGTAVLIQYENDVTHIEDYFELHTDDRTGTIQWIDDEDITPKKEWQLSPESLPDSIFKLNDFIFGADWNKNLVNLRKMLGRK